MVKKYSLIKIIIPGVYYQPNIYEDCCEYANDLEDQIGIIIKEVELINNNLFDNEKGFSIYVNGIIITLFSNQFEYI